MQEELTKMLPDLKKALETGVAYAGDLFNRAVIYYKFQTILWLIFDIIMISLTPIWIKWVIKAIDYDAMGYSEQERYIEEHKTSESRIIAKGVIGGLLIAIAFISLIALLFGIGDLIKLYTIPEIYMVEIITNN